MTGFPIKKQLVDKYIRFIGQIFVSMGAKDPRHNPMIKLDFRMGRQMALYQKEDSPTTRLLPLPVNFVQALDTAAQGTTPRNIAISDLTWVAFFLILRPR